MPSNQTNALTCTADIFRHFVAAAAASRRDSGLFITFLVSPLRLLSLFAILSTRRKWVFSDSARWGCWYCHCYRCDSADKRADRHRQSISHSSRRQIPHNMYIRRQYRDCIAACRNALWKRLLFLFAFSLATKQQRGYVYIYLCVYLCDATSPLGLRSPTRLFKPGCRPSL